MNTVDVASSPTSIVGDETSNRALIWVIENDRSTRSVLEVALARDGFDVWSIARPEDVAQLSTARVPDVVVVDRSVDPDATAAFIALLRRTATDPEKTRLVVLSNQHVSSTAAIPAGAHAVVHTPTYARDISALIRLELARRDGATTLDFMAEQVKPAHLIRAFLSSPIEARVTLANGMGSISLRDGHVQSATFGKDDGIDALVRAIVLTRGVYTVELTSQAMPLAPCCGLMEFIDVAMPRIAKFEAAAMHAVPLDSVLGLDFQHLAASLASLPDEVNQLVRLFDGRRSVLDVLRDSDFDPFLTLEVATRLYMMGVVGPVKRPGVKDSLIPDSSLFEPVAGEATQLMRALFNETRPVRVADAALVNVEAPLPLVRPAAGADLANENEWQALALAESEAVKHELAPALARQIGAFQTAMEVEAPQPSASEAAVESFARGQLDAEEGFGEIAFGSVSSEETPTPPLGNDRGAHLLELERAPQVVTDQRILAQDRIQTPWLTPVVQVADMPTITAAPVTPTAVTSTAVAAGAPSEADLESKFFAQHENAPELGPEPKTVVDGTKSAPQRNKALTYVAIVVVVLSIGVGLESLISNIGEPAPAPVVAAPVVASPPAPAPVVEPVVEAPVVEQIDVTEAIVEGHKLYLAGNYKEAISMFEQVVSDDPKSVRGWFELALANYDFGRTAESKKAVAKVLELEPNNAPVQIVIASTALDSGDKAAAQAALEKYLAVAPNGEHAEEARKLLARTMR